MRVKESALFAEEMNDLDGIAALPEKMAEIAVGADFFADGFAQFQKRAGIVDHEIGVHFEGQTFGCRGTSVFGGVFPVGDDFFFFHCHCSISSYSGASDR